jgi:hypothetical protein
VVPLAVAAGVVIASRGTVHREAATVEAPSRFDLVAFARLHRLWVADHGPGCARTMAHLAVYVPGHQITDPWGSDLHLVCERRGTSRYQLVVTVTSSGPDRILGTADDIAGTDYSDGGAVPGAIEHAETEIMLDEIREAGIDYLAYHHECFHTTDDILMGLFETLRVRDAWNSPIAVDCTGGTISATSPGPDRVAGTGDDLHVADTWTND